MAYKLHTTYLPDLLPFIVSCGRGCHVHRRNGMNLTADFLQVDVFSYIIHCFEK